MTWNSTCPNGSVSVKDNNTVISQNMSFTNTKMQNDHYWADDATKAGYHKKVDMVKEASAPTLVNDGVIYALDNVSTQPFFRNSSDIMQLLGVRAMAVFNSAGTLAYNYNVSSVSNSSTGKYTINYTNALPNTNYLVLGGAIRNDSDTSKELIFYVQAATSVSTVKSTSLVKVMCKSDGGSLTAPLQMWVVCFGG